MERTAVSYSGRDWSWEQLGRAVRVVQDLLVQRGIQPGCTTLLALENSIEYLVVLLALLSIGCRTAVINPGTPKETLQDYVEYLQAEFCIVEGKSDHELVHSHFLCLKQEVTAALTSSFEKSDNLSNAWTPEELMAQTTGGILQMSSGSTGTSKIVFRTVPNLIAEGRSYQATLKIHPDDVILVVLPLYHSYPQGFCLFGWLVSRCRIIIMARFLPAAVVSHLQKDRVTLLPLVPVVARLLIESNVPQMSFPSLRYAMVGAGPVTPSLEQKFMEKFGHSLTGNYGSTETGALCVRLSPLSEENGFYGIAMQGVEIEIRNDQGEPVLSPVTGNIWVHTSACMKGYLQSNGTLVSVTDQGGWFPMGDFGCWTGEGILVQGRNKTIVDRGGIKVNPAKVERVLLSTPGIREAVVFGEGRQLMTKEERICAVIVLEDSYNLSIQEIRTFIKNRLSLLEVPDVIKIADHIPYLPNGKPDYQTMLREFPQMVQYKHKES